MVVLLGRKKIAFLITKKIMRKKGRKEENI